MAKWILNKWAAFPLNDKSGEVSKVFSGELGLAFTPSAINLSYVELKIFGGKHYFYALIITSNQSRIPSSGESVVSWIQTQDGHPLFIEYLP